MNLLWSASFTPDKAVELEGRAAAKVVQLRVERGCRMGAALMSIRQELRDTREKFRLIYQRFESVMAMFLTASIAVIVVAA
ncbi:MAG TPA: hypothetical protein VHQ92_18500 [Pseudolabrys sp.]|nr:hypothetical protein [Pseudolabrys sp.]